MNQIGKKAIFDQLQQDILSLQGFRQLPTASASAIGFGPMNDAFPNHHFPLAATHEFITHDAGSLAATTGFIAGIMGSLMQKGAAGLWISCSRILFPPALKTFGIDPQRIIFVDLRNEKDVLWVIEEGLKCTGIAGVVGDIRTISFTSSRRFQLAAEQSKVTGFIITHPLKNTINACTSRWQITSLPANAEENIPGIAHPRWKVELLKIRNGKPGTWIAEWTSSGFVITDATTDQITIQEETLRKKAG